MSLHRSLRVDKAGAAARTVLTRIERIKELMKKGQWADERVTNLPKTKVLRVKAGKKKVKEAAAGAPAAGAAAPAAGKAAAPAAKAPAKK